MIQCLLPLPRRLLSRTVTAHPVPPKGVLESQEAPGWMRLLLHSAVPVILLPAERVRTWAAGSPPRTCGKEDDRVRTLGSDNPGIAEAVLALLLPSAAEVAAATALPPLAASSHQAPPPGGLPLRRRRPQCWVAPWEDSGPSMFHGRL